MLVTCKLILLRTLNTQVKTFLHISHLLIILNEPWVNNGATMIWDKGCQSLSNHWSKNFTLKFLIFPLKSILISLMSFFFKTGCFIIILKHIFKFMIFLTLHCKNDSSKNYIVWPLEFILNSVLGFAIAFCLATML